MGRVWRLWQMNVMTPLPAMFIVTVPAVLLGWCTVDPTSGLPSLPPAELRRSVRCAGVSLGAWATLGASVRRSVPSGPCGAGGAGRGRTAGRAGGAGTALAPAGPDRAGVAGRRRRDRVPRSPEDLAGLPGLSWFHETGVSRCPQRLSWLLDGSDGSIEPERAVELVRHPISAGSPWRSRTRSSAAGRERRHDAYQQRQAVPEPPHR